MSCRSRRRRSRHDEYERAKAAEARMAARPPTVEALRAFLRSDPRFFFQGFN